MFTVYTKRKGDIWRRGTKSFRSLESAVKYAALSSIEFGQAGVYDEEIRRIVFRAEFASTYLID